MTPRIYPRAPLPPLWGAPAPALPGPRPGWHAGAVLLQPFIRLGIRIRHLSHIHDIGVNLVLPTVSAYKTLIITTETTLTNSHIPHSVLHQNELHRSLPRPRRLRRNPQTARPHPQPQAQRRQRNPLCEPPPSHHLTFPPLTICIKARLRPRHRQLQTRRQVQVQRRCRRRHRHRPQGRVHPPRRRRSLRQRKRTRHRHPNLRHPPLNPLHHDQNLVPPRRNNPTSL